jgi:hypothetical protein
MMCVALVRAEMELLYYKYDMGERSSERSSPRIRYGVYFTHNCMNRGRDCLYCSSLVSRETSNVNGNPAHYIM